MYSRIFTNNNRVKSILKELISAEKAITGKSLAKIIGVSDRTIRDDIKEINQQKNELGISIKGIRGEGYLISVEDNKLYNKFLRFMLQEDQKNDYIVPTLPDDRIKYIIKKLFVVKGYLTLENLAKELFVSKTTINGDLIKVEDILNEYGLKVYKKRYYGIRLDGDEVKIRLFLSRFLANGNEITNVQTIDFSNTILKNVNLEKIKEVLFKNIQQAELKLSDITFNNLVVHIAISIQRIKSGWNIEKLPLKNVREVKSTKEYSVAQNIVSNIQSIFDVNIHEEEVLYITMHLLSKKVIFDNNENYSQLEEVVGHEILSLLEEIIEEIYIRYQIDLRDDDEFIFNLGMHLKPALNRIKYGMYLENPVLEEIKRNYSYAFEMGITAGQTVLNYINHEIDEHEIGYIAMHFASALERRKYMYQSNFEKVLLVCASGVGTAKLLEVKIKRIINDVKVVTTLPSYQLQDVNIEEFDLVLTTIPLDIKSNVPIIQVSALLTNDDIKKINKVTNGKVGEKFCFFETRNILVTMFQKDLFIPGLEAKDEYDVINKMCSMLEDRDYVDDDFKKLVVTREKISSTSYGNLVAIPHAINKKDIGIKIATSILKKPIIWGDENVQLVLLLVLPQQMDENFEEFFEELLEFVENKSLVSNLLQTKEFIEFIDYIKIANN